MPPVVLAWAKEVSARYDYSVPSVCFMHRPIKEMKDRANESTIEGFAFEGVGSAPDKGEMHEMLMAIKTVKACFFGHDHSNNFYCDSGGIRYHSARKSLSLSYGARSCENALFRKNGSRPDIRWGLTSIKLSMNTGALDVKTVLENGDVFQTYRIP